MVVTFEIVVSYGQICVFQANLETPYNDWVKVHTQQGFTWRPISVSFSVLEDAISCDATVQIQSKPSLRTDTLRAIQVPFSVKQNCGVIVGSILSETEVRVPEGEYCLIYEVGINAGELDDLTERAEIWCILTFVPTENAEARILIQDEQLNPPIPLYMEGWPA